VLLRILVAAGLGIVLAQAFEPVALPIVIPFAVAGFVLCCRGLPARRAWLPGLAFGIGFQWTLLFWMRAVGTDAWIGLASVEAAFLALLGSLTAVLVRHRWWPLWVAAAWTAVEVWRSGWPFSGMPWGRLAFATADTFVAGALPWIGAVGVSFALALSGTLLAWVVVARGRERRTAVLGLAALVAALLVPVALPWEGEMDGEQVVAAIQPDVPGPGNDILYDPRGVTQNLVDVTARLADDVAAGAQPQPDFVVWPENSTTMDPFRHDDLNALITGSAQRIGAPILVGAIVDAGTEHVLNQGIVWDPVTGAGERYTKRHPVPFGEYIPARKLFTRQFGRLAEVGRDMRSGTRNDPLTIAGTEVADAICFDVAYDDGIYAQVSRGAQVLTVQTSNATFIYTHQIAQQFAITRLRAIETGRWLVVAATNGVSGVIAPDGTVVASAPTRAQAALVESVQLTTSVPPSVRIGPWSGRLCVLITALGLALALVPYRRQRNTPEVPPEPELAGASESRSE
jgi:apolipoprotein N-acyltransferase